jgi:chromosome segregation ATPase
LSDSSQAYQLFLEGKSPIQVAIKLGLKEPEVHELYSQYWNLQQLYSLYQVHQQVKENIWYFVELYRLIKAAGMGLKHVKKLLEIANNELPIVQAKYEGLRREVGLLESEKESLEKQIFDLHATLVQYRTSYREESALIDTLHQERLEPKDSVREFENNNED